MDKNFLLLGIIGSYLYPIYIINDKYNHDKSISHIICNDESKSMIFNHLMIMNFFLLLYEIKRNDKLSMEIISIFVICSLILVNIKEDNLYHISFTILAFTCLILFMKIHKNKSKMLIFMFYIQLIISFLLIIDYLLGYTLFILEMIFLINFGTYFLILHFL